MARPVAHDANDANDADGLIGRVLDDEFRLEAKIGEGATAEVYRASQLSVGRNVALKLLREAVLLRPDVVRRFQREARVAARLQHPNLVALHLTGTLRGGPTEPERPYAVFELAQGESLAVRVGRRGPLPLSETLAIVRQVSEAVAHAHENGVVHRDIKPENIVLLEQSGRGDFVKLLDFGLARSDDESGLEPATREGAILGTPRFMSPEAAEGHAAGPPADCYALATLAYLCLTGRTPFEGGEALALLIQKSQETAPDLRALPGAHDVPEAVAHVIMKNLSRSPEDRAPDARRFLEAIDGALVRTDLEASPTRAHTAPPRAHALPDGRSLPVAARPRHPRSDAARNMVIILACLLVGVALALGIASSLGALSAPARQGAAP